jgi:cyclophilin family peptidyl-prolyl cis-trans isomerase
MGTEKRQRQKEGHRLSKEEMRRLEKKRKARRRLMFWGAAVILFFGIFFVVSLITGDDDPDEDEVATTGSTAPSTSVAPSTTNPGPTTTVESTTECPAADGSSERRDSFETPPPTCIDPAKSYVAVFDTSEGEIRVDLDTENTPNTVNNFVTLARYHYYDDTPVFRTDPSIGIIQAGGADNQSSPGYTIPDEGDGYTYEPGQLVMARSNAPDSAGAQFFLVGTDAASSLDAQGTYVVFGMTDDAGLQVVNDILDLHEDDPTSDLGGGPSRPVTINSVTIEES